MHRSRQPVARLIVLGTITLAACQDASQSPTAPVVPQAPVAARSPQAQARLEAIFQNASPEVMALPGTVFADNDEVVGKVVFGVENANAINGVRHALQRLGIDEADYEVQITKPIVMAASLRDAWRPTRGGIQLHFSRYVCTLGFNATADDGSRSFITNSHCTATQGGVENTAYYQPTSSNGAAIATEVEDPDYVKGGSCPKGKKCRHADVSRAVYASATASTLGAIARTSAANNGSLEVTGSFTIGSAEDGTKEFTVGRGVNKVGRTTGWTRGTVNRTCVNTSVSGSTVYLYCQTFVSNPNATVVGGGDSGSAAFGDPNSSGAVALLGILWGGSSDGRSFVFSPLQSIEQEIGQLTVR
jgi:hypothetical protein